MAHPYVPSPFEGHEMALGMDQHRFFVVVHEPVDLEKYGARFVEPGNIDPRVKHMEQDSLIYQRFWLPQGVFGEDIHEQVVNFSHYADRIFNKFNGIDYHPEIRFIGATATIKDLFGWELPNIDPDNPKIPT